MKVSVKYLILILFFLVPSSLTSQEQCVFAGTICRLRGVLSTEELIAISRDKQFADVAKIRLLDGFAFEYSSLERFPTEFFKVFPNLRSLIAENVGIQEISFADKSSLKLLKYLILSKNKISLLDLDDFKHFDDIWFVSLYGNQISAVIDSSEKSSLARIKYLYLQGNNIKVFNISTLETTNLYLKNNLLEFFKNPFGVETLELDNNKLTELFISKSMKIVSAMNNKIKNVKCDSNLSIEELYLAGNRIEDDVFATLKNAKKLKVLDLSRTMISELTSDSLSELESLEELSLADTNISNLRFGLFSQQAKLLYLDLARNNLAFIDWNWFKPLVSLEKLDISENNLVELRNCENIGKMFLPKLENLRIGGNRWTCEHMRHLELTFEKLDMSFDSADKKVTVLDALDIEEFLNLWKQFFESLHASNFNLFSLKNTFCFLLEIKFGDKINQKLGKQSQLNNSRNRKICEKILKFLIERSPGVSPKNSFSSDRIIEECE